MIRSGATDETINEALKQEINLLKIENQNQQTNTEILVSDNTEKLNRDIEDQKQSSSTEESTQKFPVDISLILEDSDENRAKYMELFPKSHQKELYICDQNSEQQCSKKLKIP